MYSAFSFGKIIKTILPGSILAGTLFLIAETVWFHAWHTSLLASLISKEVVTVAGAALVPISLILGFLLNTFVWLNMNVAVRRQVDAALAGTPFAQLRAALCERIRRDVDALIGVERAESCKKGWPPRLSLEYYFLPVVSVEHLSHLWESYFSWYEFHMNTLCAVGIATVTGVAVLVLRSPMEWMWTGALAVAMIGACIVFCRTLWASAIRNMVTYERNLVLLVASAIAAPPAATGQPKP